jgi:tetratricopeptide (TPR) repeat protein
VNRVKNDILNGWKEIAGYLGRDRRTVERWEKQRGLPVRRVPGAGRASVYALISELDEWLANSNITEASLADTEQESPPAQAALYGGERGDEPFGADSNAWPNEGQSAAAMHEPVTALQKSTPLSRYGIRSGWLVAWTFLAGLILFFVLALPAVRRHLSPIVESPKPNTEINRATNALHHHSQVAGVDDLYLEGIYSYEQRTPESLERAQQDFESAIQKDPDYAPAYAALADTYSLLREYYVMPNEEAFTKAKAAAQHAVALDTTLSDAHASLGFIDFFWSWDAASAEREFRTAIADDSSSAHAHHWYGSMLTHEGRYQEALDQLDIAQKLEPTSAAILSTRALALGLSGHRAEAVELLEGVINESPGVSAPHEIFAIVSRVEPADFGRYLEEMRRAGELRHSDEMLQVAAAGEGALHSAGEHAMWTAILATEEKLHPGSADRTYIMVDAEAALGRDDAAFASMNQLAQRHEPDVLGVAMDPTLAPLRRDRRFGHELQVLGLPDLAQ